MTVGSDFSCSMGMMMAENIPFMHSLAQSIIDVQGIGLDAMSTTMTAFAISTIVMGICFMALGQYQLGKAVSYFPRHFLIGCIGGIGIFVTQPGFEVSTGVPWSWIWMSLERYGSQELCNLSFVAAVFVLILSIALRFIRWSLFPPFFFVGIIPVFYLALLTLGISPDVARENSWLFEHPPITDVWILWTSCGFSSVRWDLILALTPTMVALTCFGLMHAPINIPSLSVSTGIEVDMNQELIVHGWSNMLSGCLGGLPNYLCYSNSLLCHKCGGGGRLSGFVLCTILLAAMVAGQGAIAYVPRCMAGCLLIHVGLELSKEALVDSLEAFDTFELLITIVMTTMGMTAGLGFGLVLSAVSFTLQHIRHCDPIRGAMPAATLRSSFRRTREERDLLYESLRHARVVQLQGALFFGNAAFLVLRRDACSIRW
ncbi:unnamed protein product [Polarella glacialis]|uniref:SLC26A/SulP transporter domain-containing protein n=1 Tax=Polarella glacialis TaxID=89957 RepID=A0A813LQX1_POLGL|nr:unnamed protein product [Polarella glacialis]